MIDLRRVAIIFVIAILYAVLVNAIISAVYPAPRYEDFCKTQFYPEKPYPAGEVKCPAYKEPTVDELNQCAEQGGYPDYVRDANNCPIQYKGCNFCQRDLNDANEKYNFWVFIISAIMGLVAVGIGLMLPFDNDLNEWIATGFMLGGLATLFFGTVRYYQYLGRYIRPIVIFVELVIVIFLAYKKLRDAKSDRSKKKRR